MPAMKATFSGSLSAVVEARVEADDALSSSPQPTANSATAASISANSARMLLRWGMGMLLLLCCVPWLTEATGRGGRVRSTTFVLSAQVLAAVASTGTKSKS